MCASDRALCPLLDFKMGVCRLERTSTTAISRIEQEAHGMKASTVPMLWRTLVWINAADNGVL